MNTRTKKITLFISITALIMLLIYYIVYSVLPTIGKNKISFHVAPDDEKVMLFIDGVKANIRGDSVFVKNGTHTYKVSREHFRDIEGKIAEEDKYIIASLAPSDEEGEKIAQKSAKQYFTLEGIAGKRSVEESEIFHKKHKITEHLPYRNMLFTIGYKYNQKTDHVVITVRAASIYYQAAINKIREWGFNPAELDIKIVDEENSFI